jgi:hypothetical protein
MAKPDVSPDNLARKTFLMTVAGALLYITVVFTFVIAGNRREEQQAQPPQDPNTLAESHD